MGHGSYSVNSYASRSVARENLQQNDIFEQNKIRRTHHDMVPNGVIRESRDSDEHPESYPVIIALDVTGSMGKIPERLMKGTLNKVMSPIVERGFNDVQVCFIAIGDHETDQSPLQVGQFETSDELIEKWLGHTFIEGNGGGNNGESYFLAWSFAADQTVTDAWEKRKKKGLVITIGDEPCLKKISGPAYNHIVGMGAQGSINAYEFAERAKERYHLVHFHIKDGFRGRRPDVSGWERLVDQFIQVDSTDLADKMGETILQHLHKYPNITEGETEEGETQML